MTDSNTFLPVLATDLDLATLNNGGTTSANAVRDDRGIKLVANPSENNTLAGTAFNAKPYLAQIKSLGTTGVVAGDSVSSLQMATASMAPLKLTAGETLTITYAWTTFDQSATNKDYAFALIQREGGSEAAVTLANRQLLQSSGYTTQGTFGLSLHIKTGGIYDLVLGDVYNGSSSGSAVRIESITIAEPVTGSNATTFTPDGLRRSDGSIFAENGSLLGTDGTTTPVLSPGAGAVISVADGHLISQDGGSLISQDGGSVISNDGSSLISQDGGSLVSNSGSTIISRDGAGLVNSTTGFISHNGSAFASGQARAFAAASTSSASVDSVSFTSAYNASSGMGDASGGGGLYYYGPGPDGLDRYFVRPAALQSATFTPPAQTLVSPHQLGGTITVGSGPTANVAQGDGAVASLSNGNFVVAWDDDAGAPGHFEIRAQIFKPDGTALAPSFVVSTDTTHGSQEKPSVVGVQGGGFAVSWLGVQDANHSQADVHLQLFDANGGKVQGEARVGLTGVTDLGAKLGSTWDGGFVLTYEQKNSNGDSAGVAVRYDKDRTVVGGAPIGDYEGLGAASGVNVSDLTSIGLSNNDFVVAYRERSPNGPSGTTGADHDGIFVDLVKADGSSGFTKVQVNTTTTGSQYTPSIARLNNNNIVVAWVDSGTSFTAGQAIVRAQVINAATGAKIGGELTIGATLAGQDTGPAVVALDQGGFSVTWTAVSLNNGRLVGAHLETQTFSNDGAQESPIVAVPPISTDGTFFDKAPVAAQVGTSDGHTIFIVGQHTQGSSTSIEATAFTNDDRYVAASQAPSGQDVTAFLNTEFDSSPPHNKIRDAYFNLGSFGFSDADGDQLSGVTITSTPTSGTLYDKGVAVHAGDFISAADLSSFGNVVYKTTDTTTANFTQSFKFQVHDTGGTTFGGSNVDATPNTVTLKVNAPPVIANVAANATLTSGQTSVVLSPGITLSDDGGMLSGAHVTISNQGFLAGDTLSANGVANGTIANTNISVSSTTYGLTFSGDDTVSHYQQVLSSVSYSYTGSQTAAGAHDARTIYWDVSDTEYSQSVGLPSTTVSSPPSLAVSIQGAPASHVLGTGKSVSFIVTVGSAVAVTGAPCLILSDNAKAVFNKSASDLAHGKVVFTYTAASGENTTNLAVTALAVPPGSSIKAGTTTVTTVNFPSPGIPTGLAVDTSAPLPPDHGHGDGAPALQSDLDTGRSNSDGVTSSPRLIFTGVAEAGATVTLFDGPTTKAIGSAPADQSGNYGVVTSTLSDGAHTIFAKATDAAGNTSEFSVGRPIVIDTKAPAAPAAPKLAVGFDTGALAMDGTTSIINPSFSGTAEAGSTVQIYAANNAQGLNAFLIGTATVAANGKYEAAFNAPTTPYLVNGTFTILAKATDAAGNQSGYSAPTLVTIDSSVPSTPTIGLAAGSDTGPSSSDGVTKVAKPVVTGTAEAGVTVKLYDVNGTKLLGTAVADATTGVYKITSTLAAGAHGLTVTATDAAGNVSAPSSALAVTVDTKAPLKPTLVLDAASDTGFSTKDGITSDATPSLSGKAEAGTTVTIFDGKSVIASTTAASDGTYTLTLAPLADGKHVLSARATDTAGDVSLASVAKTVTIDTTDPAVAITSPAAVGTGVKTIGGTGEAGSTVTLTENGVAVGTAVTVAANGKWSEKVNFKTAGTHDLVANAVDKAGNSATSAPPVTAHAQSLNAMVQAMATMIPASSSALTPSAAFSAPEAHLAAAHG